jgi:hypothetical protein
MAVTMKNCVFWDVSEERIASIIRAKRISVLGTLAVIRSGIQLLVTSINY